MDLFKAKQLSILLGCGLVFSALIGALLYYLLPQFYPNWFLGIVFFFLVIETLLMSFVVSKSLKVTSQKMVNVYMLAKVIKILSSLLFIAVYAIAIKEGLKNFVLVFVGFYLLYLFIEVFLYSKIERHIKEKKI